MRGPWHATGWRAVAAVILGLLAALAGPVPMAQAAPSGPGYELGMSRLTTSWTTVTLQRTYADPVVVVGPPTRLGSESTTVRVRNVRPDRFEVRLQEWNCADGTHTPEAAAYIVMERGAHTIGGLSWEAGHVEDVGGSWRTHGLAARTRGTGQTVLAQAVTARSANALVPRVRNITQASIDVQLQHERANTAPVVPERVDYIALQGGVETEGPLRFTSSRRTFSGDTAFHYGRSLPGAGVFTQITGVADPDPASIRMVGARTTDVSLSLEEDPSLPDRTHAPEEVRYLVVADVGSYSVGFSGAPASTNPACPVPLTDVVVRPGNSIQEVVDLAPEGARILLAQGTHQQQQVKPKHGQSFYGQRDAACTRLTTMSGAQRLPTWHRSGGAWFAGGVRAEGQEAGRCVEGVRCTRPEDLFFDGTPLRHVPTKDAVGPGTWWFDYANDTVYVGDDPAGHSLQVSVTPAAFASAATDVTVSGLVVERYAAPMQFGAIGGQYPGAGWVVEDNEARLNHGAGVRLGSGAVVRRNVIHDNGQVGISGNPSQALVEGNDIYGNNYAGALTTWEAGGIKVASATGVTFRRNRVHDNVGPGIWSDISSRHIDYDGNTVWGNTKEGIFHEISYDATIRNNVVGRNGSKGDGWLYGGQILVSTSKNVRISDNQVEVDAGYGNGITIIWQDRGGDHAAVDNLVEGNTTTYLGGQGQSGAYHDWTGGVGVHDRNVFRGNSYHVPDAGAAHFKWRGGNHSFDSWLAAGQDVGGRIDEVVTARAW